MSDQSLQTVRVGFGKANLTSFVTTLTAFHVGLPFVRESAVTRAAAREYREDRVYNVAGSSNMLGQLYSSTVSHKNGDILLFQSSWKTRGLAYRDGAIFVRLRESGASWRISAKLPGGPQNVLGDRFVVFAGRGDILVADDLATYGVEANRGYKEKFMSDEEVDGCFVIERISEEASPRPSVSISKAPDGSIVRTEVAAAPTRRLRFRSGG